MNKLRSLILSLFMVLPSFQAQAGGIPVIDAASIAEQVRSFVQQMQDYQALLDQLDVQSSQYTQMLLDYQQVIQEYNHYLNQIKELGLSPSQLAIIDQVATATYGNQGISYLPTIDLTSPTAADDTAVILRDGGYIARDRADVLADFQALSPDTTTLTESRYDYLAKQAQAYENQMYMVQQNETKQSGPFQNKISQYKMAIDALGPESDLATAQLMARQQNAMMEQFQELSRLQNQNIMIYESPSQAHNRRKIEALEAEIERLERVKATRDAASPQPVINGYGELF